MVAPSDGAQRLAAASAAVRATHVELRELVAQGRAELEAARSRPLLSDRERAEIQDLAARGELGRGLQEVAERVARDETDWEDVLRNRDGAFTGELDAMAEHTRVHHGDRLAAAFRDTPAPPEVDDPRRGR